MLGVVGMVVSVGRAVGAVVGVVVALVEGLVAWVVLGVVSVATFFRQPVNTAATSRALIMGNNTFFIILPPEKLGFQGYYLLLRRI